MGIFLRWLAAFGLLAATFNPTPWNYIRWTSAHYHDQLPVTVLMGLFLALGYIIALNATLNSIGVFGMVMIGAIFGCSIWVLVDWGVLKLDNTDLTLWLGIFALSLILGFGLSWSSLKQRLTGQATVDEIEE
jgi:ABC-type uncharacterized transport system permease subunit